MKKKKGLVYRRYIEKMKKITKKEIKMKTFKSYLGGGGGGGM